MRLPPRECAWLSPRLQSLKQARWLHGRILRGLQVTLEKRFDVLGQVAIENGGAHPFHVADQESEVMHTEEIVCEEFFRFDQMTDISAAEVLAAATVAIRINRLRV